MLERENKWDGEGKHALWKMGGKDGNSAKRGKLEEGRANPSSEFENDHYAPIVLLKFKVRKTEYIKDFIIQIIS